MSVYSSHRPLNLLHRLATPQTSIAQWKMGRASNAQIITTRSTADATNMPENLLAQLATYLRQVMETRSDPIDDQLSDSLEVQHNPRQDLSPAIVNVPLPPAPPTTTSNLQLHSPVTTHREAPCHPFLLVCRVGQYTSMAVKRWYCRRQYAILLNFVITAKPVS